MRDNAASFDGSPGRIIVCGQSAGAAAADYWAYAYPHDAVARGLVAHSGTAPGFPVHAPGAAARNWRAVVAAVGCARGGHGADHEIMACMRRAPWQDIVRAAAAVKPSPSSSVLRPAPPFYPAPDGELVFADYANRSAAGRFARISVLLGSTDHKDGWYRLTARARGTDASDADAASFVRSTFTCLVLRQAEARRGRSGTAPTGPARGCTRAAAPTTASTCTWSSAPRPTPVASRRRRTSAG